MSDILFTYQHKPREIEVLCLLKLELEKRGHTVDFTCTFKADRIFSFFRKTRLVVSSAMYNDDVLWFMVYDIAGFVDKVINLQWEQVLSNSDEADPSCFHNPNGYAREVLHLCWGEAPHNRIVSAGVPATKAPVIGAIHLDFLLPEFESYFLDRQNLALKFNLDSKKEWSIFISSFTMHNMTEEELNQLLEYYGDEILELKRLTILSKMHILIWIESVLTEFPDKIFIYRPHPDETTDESLKEVEKKYKNFVIIPDLSVKQWIKCSDRIYTWYSTSVAEIEKAGKGFDILRPVEIPSVYDVSIYRGAKFLTSQDGFRSSLLADHQEMPLDSTILHNYYRNNKSYPAYMQAADLIESSLLSSENNMQKHPSAASVNLGVIKKKLKEDVIDLLINLFGRHSEKLPYVGETLKYSRSFRERMKRDLHKNLATEEEIGIICSQLRPIVYADYFSKNKVQPG